MMIWFPWDTSHVAFELPLPIVSMWGASLQGKQKKKKKKASFLAITNYSQ